MRLLVKLSIFTVVLATPLFAQYAPAPAAEITPGDIAVGYSHLRLGFSGKPAVDLNGVDVSGTININPSWGATLDSSYVRAGRDLESGHSSSVLSAFAGPVFTAAQKHNLRFLIRPLVGMTLVDGSVPVSDVFFRGWESRFSWAIGGGIEYDLSPSYAVRFNADYLRAHFVSSNAAVEPQNGIRFSTNFVFRLSPRSRNAKIESDRN
ncbi:MAG TPA: outer membrane beta-barrel protein [Candidatus Sulfotelmatobacter sp.]|nr:outer membrane beta-barrel protein [Candidatus Sulfotelmatobacter sp.]